MKIEVELQPFAVPNYVLSVSKARPRQEGYAESPKWHLSDLDEQSLSDLCDQFRRDVFTKAGKVDPRNDQETT